MNEAIEKGDFAMRVLGGTGAGPKAQEKAKQLLEQSLDALVGKKKK